MLLSTAVRFYFSNVNMQMRFEAVGHEARMKQAPRSVMKCSLRDVNCTFPASQDVLKASHGTVRNGASKAYGQTPWLSWSVRACVAQGCAEISGSPLTALICG